MRFRTRARSDTLDAATIVLFVFWVATLVLERWIWWMWIGQTVRSQDTLATAIQLYAALLAVLVSWTILSLLGRVAAWTGYGLRLAALGLFSWSCGEILSAFGGLHSSRFPAPEPAATWAWLVRNTSLIAFGLGLGLVVVYSSIDLLRRSRLVRTGGIALDA